MARIKNILLTLFLPTVLFGQNPHDSLVTLYKSDNLIEYIKPFVPELRKITKNTLTLDGVYVKNNYGKLKNGEIRIYNRFYQLIERQQFKDSTLIIEESFENERRTDQTRRLLIDSTYIYTSYYTNGNPRIQSISKPTSEMTTKWFEDGKIESVCTQIGDQQKCDNWDKNGLYTFSTIREFKDRIMISEITVDATGRLIDKK